MLTRGREKSSGLICSFFFLVYFLKLLSWVRHHERLLGFRGPIGRSLPCRTVWLIGAKCIGSPCLLHLGSRGSPSDVGASTPIIPACIQQVGLLKPQKSSWKGEAEKNFFFFFFFFGVNFLSKSLPAENRESMLHKHHHLQK